MLPTSPFWAAAWKVAGFLLLIGWLQMIIDTVATLFGILPVVAPAWSNWVLAISAVLVPIWGTLTFIDWRWGWKPDNAGLRRTPAALFWLFPGLVGGALAAVLALLIQGYLSGGQTAMPALNLSLTVLPSLLLVAGGAFATELVYRGAVVSRLQYDVSGPNLLILATLVPVAWGFLQGLGLGLVNPRPSADIAGLGSVALSVFLTMLFLRTDSVWLAAGVRAGLLVTLSLMPRLPIETGLLVTFGIPAAILILLELAKSRNLRRPGGGPRRGTQRVVYGKTVRGPWGPH